LRELKKRGEERDGVGRNLRGLRDEGLSEL